MNTINSYSSPYTLGHKATDDLFDGGNVYVQEKVDGSQISFGNIDGELVIRSRNATINQEKPEMFKLAVDAIKAVWEKMPVGRIYRGEYLSKPKHNTIEYGRVPKNNIILFDIDTGNQHYMCYEEVCGEADRLGFEVVPQLAVFTEKPSLEEISKLLETDSILGGAKIEGVVMKNYNQFDTGDKVLMAKFVSEKFKEKHANDWRRRNPTKGDIVDILISEYKTDARWMKAIQHLKEEGKIGMVVQDIPILLKEVSQDIKEECEEEIKEKLFKYFWGGISRGVTRGLPEFYKEYLAQEYFGKQ